MRPKQSQELAVSRQFGLVSVFEPFVPYSPFDKTFTALYEHIRQKTLQSLSRPFHRSLVIVANALQLTKFQLSMLFVLFDNFKSLKWEDSDFWNIGFVNRVPQLRDFRASLPFNQLFNKTLFLALVTKVSCHEALVKETQAYFDFTDKEKLTFQRFYKQNSSIIQSIQLFEVNNYHKLIGQNESKERSFTAVQMVQRVINSK